MKHRAYIQSRSRAFTLLEVGIASVILPLVAISVILTVVYANRASTLASLQLNAAHVLQGEIERIRGDRYENVDTLHYPDALPGTSTERFLDEQQRIPLTVNYDILSTFPVTQGGTLTFRVGGIPSNNIRSGSFFTNELTSNTVVICSGTGVTQTAVVTANTASEISITTDMSQQTVKGWTVEPDSTSAVQFNMGKVVTVRISWAFLGRQYMEEMRTLVVLPLEL